MSHLVFDDEVALAHGSREIANGHTQSPVAAHCGRAASNRVIEPEPIIRVIGFASRAAGERVRPVIEERTTVRALGFAIGVRFGVNLNRAIEIGDPAGVAGFHCPTRNFGAHAIAVREPSVVECGKSVVHPLLDGGRHTGLDRSRRRSAGSPTDAQVNLPFAQHDVVEQPILAVLDVTS